MIVFWNDIKERIPDPEGNKGDNPQQSVEHATEHKNVLKRDKTDNNGGASDGARSEQGRGETTLTHIGGMDG
jgi:hypothetical protein